MIKKAKLLLASLLGAPLIAIAGLALTPVVTTVSAADCPSTLDPSSLSVSTGVTCAKGNSYSGNLFGNGSIFNTIVNVLLFLVGAISVVMLIIGGIRYTISGGEAKAVGEAKNTILYAIVGLVIAFLAYAIVNWVLGGIGSSNSNS